MGAFLARWYLMLLSFAVVRLFRHPMAAYVSYICLYEREIQKGGLGGSGSVHFYARRGNEISSRLGAREGDVVANRLCQWLTKIGYQY